MIFRLISASTETTNIIRYKEARGEVAISGRPKHVTFVATWVEGDADGSWWEVKFDGGELSDELEAGLSDNLYEHYVNGIERTIQWH